MPSTKGWGQQMAGLKRLVFALCAAGALAGYGGGAATAQDQGVAIVEAREADAAAPKSAEIPTAAFATRSAVQAVALSPDGSKLAFRLTSTGVDIGRGPSRSLVSDAQTGSVPAARRAVVRARACGPKQASPGGGNQRTSRLS